MWWQVYLNLQAHATSRMGKGAKNSSAFLKSPTSTLLHTISESEKASYVGHINNYLGEDSFLKKFLPIDPSTNDLFEIAKDGVLIWWISINDLFENAFDRLMLLNFANLIMFLLIDAVSLLMWLSQGQSMKEPLILRQPLTRGKETKIIPYASILPRQLDALWLT